MNCNTKGMTMQTPTFVPFWNIGQSMSGLKNELFKNLH